MLKKVLGGVAGLALLAGCGSQTIEERIVEVTENEPNWEVECQHAIDIFNEELSLALNVVEINSSDIQNVILIGEDVVAVCEGVIHDDALIQLDFMLEDLKGMQ